MSGHVEIVPPPGATCTVGPRATDGSRCGGPAVTGFRTSRGETFFECEHHDVSGIVATSPRPAAGSTVEVMHVGKVKRGTVVSATATFASVEVDNADGTSKIVQRRWEDVR